MVLKKSLGVMLCAILVFLLVSIGYCQELKIDEETRKVCNQLMKRIYEDILKEKDNYRELENFDKSALHIREDSIYSISYRHNIKWVKFKRAKATGKAPFQFLITILGIDEHWQKQNEFYDLEYHNLGLKVYGVFARSQALCRKPKDIKSDLTRKISNIVRKNTRILDAFQSERFPLKLVVESDKKVYELKDKSITVKFTMENISEDKIRPFYILIRSFILINDKEYEFGHISWRGNIEGWIDPGQKFEYSLNLKADRRMKEQINKVGKYSISWKYGALTSNTITVEIFERNREG